jgi:glyoxylase I family protein
MDIEHVAFNVTDPEKIALWYTTHLGMHVVRRVDGPTHTHFLADSAGRVVVEFYHHARAAVPDYSAMDPLVLHLAFTTVNVGETQKMLEEAGAKNAGEITVTPAGDEMVLLRDPWGLAIQLVRRARSLMEH